MNFVKQIERLQLLNRLIRQERTGRPEELARRLGVSRSKLHELLGAVKSWGMEIRYDRHGQSFVYEKEKNELEINFSLKVIKEGECKKIYGGSHFFPSVLFSGRNDAILDLQLTG